MKINGLVLTAEDLNQRYQNSFVRGQITGEEEKIYYIHRFGAGSIIVSPFQNEKKEILTSKFGILQDFPQMGAVNHEGDVHFLTRKPLRQWKRGFSYELIHDFCRTNPVRTFSGYVLSYPHAVSCFNRTWIPVKEGITNQNLRSFAINEHYWISGKNKKYLWRDICCLGEILGNKLFVFPSVCIMKDEINQELGGQYEIS